MTPRRERARAFDHACVARQLGHQMRRNKIAELAKKRELSWRWLALSLFFIPRLVAGIKPASQLFFTKKPSHPEELH